MVELPPRFGLTTSLLWSEKPGEPTRISDLPTDHALLSQTPASVSPDNYMVHQRNAQEFTDLGESSRDSDMFF